MRLGQIADQIVKDEKWAEQQYEIAYDYYFEGDWLSAEHFLRDAMAVSPFDSRYRLLLAQVYCGRGWLSMSYSVLAGLRNIDPENAGAKSLELLLRTKMRERHAAGSGRKASGQTGWRSIFGFSLSWFHKSSAPSQSRLRHRHHLRYH